MFCSLCNVGLQWLNMSHVYALILQGNLIKNRKNLYFQEDVIPQDVVQPHFLPCPRMCHINKKGIQFSLLNLDFPFFHFKAKNSLQKLALVCEQISLITWARYFIMINAMVVKFKCNYEEDSTSWKCPFWPK